MDWSLVTEKIARELVAERCGGKNFDEKGEGYSFSDVLDDERELEKRNIPGDKGSALLKFSVADPTWKMNIEALMRALEFFFMNPKATRYTDLSGIWINKKDTNAILASILGLPNSDWVQYSPGSIKRALAEYIPTAFFGKENLLIFPDPGYGIIKNPMNNKGIQVLNINMEEHNGRWRIPLEKIKIPAGARRRFMYVNNPHNPTGTAFTVEELSFLIEWALHNRVVLIFDEAYDNLRYIGSPSIMSIPGWESCCMVLQSISKGWNATGLRFGWMIADPILIRALRKVCDVKDSGLFGLTIMMGIACLQNPQWAEGTKDRYWNLHKLLLNGLQEAGFKSQMPEAGLCLFTKAPKAINGKEFPVFEDMAIMLREDVRISIMHHEVGGERYLRLAATD
jgi:aspartate/methionine/tyrosine aminotransferase